MPSAEIITIGTEILLGEIVDTNTRHIALTLRDLAWTYIARSQSATIWIASPLQYATR